MAWTSDPTAENQDLKNPTPENHRALHVPWIDWDREYREWKWPYWKFGYKNPDVLFHSLHAEFNCMPFAIQDPHAWFCDANEVAVASKTREEFEAALLKRRNERFLEIRKAWTTTKPKLLRSSLWTSPNIDRGNQWGTYVRFARNFSFDCITAHFGNYLPENHRAPEAPELDQPNEPEQPDPPIREPSPPRPTPSPSPAPPQTRKSRQTKVNRERVAKGPGRSSRVEKPPPRRTTAKTKAPQGVRRSARLQQRAERDS
ncbi:hypothetical protein F4802DRAFT_600783 [Xylaria palmicola]|nr:hypothetical protein F4802DRAFT_600783 [Xylaria palmicola]